MNVDEYFSDYSESRRLFDRLLDLTDGLTPITFRVTTSQIALHHTKPFAWVWVPEKHVHRRAAPLVLSIAFPQRDPSPRWKQIVEPARGRFMHHLEIHSLTDLDDEVRVWLHTAWTNAGNFP